MSVNTVKLLATARLGEKGQLTIPTKYRQSLALAPGASFTVVRIGNGLLLVPEQARFQELCHRVAKAFSKRGIEAAADLATLLEAREAVYGRLYPQLAKRGRSAKCRNASTAIARRG